MVGSVGDFVRCWCRGDFMGWSVVKSREVFAVENFCTDVWNSVVAKCCGRGL